MKNKLYYWGLISCMVITIGGLFKIMHWPGANIGLTLGMALLCLLFLPFAMKSSFENEENKRLKVLYIIATIVLAINFISALFKIMHWPGASILFIVSLPLPFVLLLPAYLFWNKNDKEINYSNFMAVIFFFAYFAAISSLLSLSVSRNVLDSYIKSANTFEEKAKTLNNQIKWYLKISKNDSTILTSNMKLVNTILLKANELSDKTEALKKHLIITSSGNSDEVISKSAKFDLLQIKNKEATVFIDSGYINNLKESLIAFKVLLKQMPNGLKNIPDIDQFIDTSDSEFEPWDKKILNGKILVAAIDALALIQYQVRLVEYNAISNLE